MAGQDFVGPLLLAEAQSAVGERRAFLETRLAGLLEAREWWAIGHAPAATIEVPVGEGAQRVSGQAQLLAPVQAMDWLCIEAGPRWLVLQAPAAARVHLSCSSWV